MSQRRRLSIVLALNIAMIAGLLILGVVPYALGVLAARSDYIADSTGVLLGIVAVTIRERLGVDSQVPTYVALMNGAALLDVTVFALGEGVHRLAQGTSSILGLPVLIVSSIAGAALFGGVLILGRDAEREDLHMRSVVLDTLSDAPLVLVRLRKVHPRRTDHWVRHTAPASRRRPSVAGTRAARPRRRMRRALDASRA